MAQAATPPAGRAAAPCAAPSHPVPGTSPPDRAPPSAPPPARVRGWKKKGGGRGLLNPPVRTICSLCQPGMVLSKLGTKCRESGARRPQGALRGRRWPLAHPPRACARRRPPTPRASQRASTRSPGPGPRPRARHARGLLPPPPPQGASGIISGSPPPPARAPRPAVCLPGYAAASRDGPCTKCPPGQVARSAPPGHKRCQECKPAKPKRGEKGGVRERSKSAPSKDRSKCVPGGDPSPCAGRQCGYVVATGGGEAHAWWGEGAKSCRGAADSACGVRSTAGRQGLAVQRCTQQHPPACPRRCRPSSQPPSPAAPARRA
jgi:hypothetical protein